MTVLQSPAGHKKVIQAFDYVRAIMKERTRFQMMVASLTNEPVEPAYQVGPKAIRMDTRIIDLKCILPWTCRQLSSAL